MGNDQTDNTMSDIGTTASGLQSVAPVINVYGQGVSDNLTSNSTQNTMLPQTSPYAAGQNPIQNQGVVSQSINGSVLDAASISTNTTLNTTLNASPIPENQNVSQTASLDMSVKQNVPQPPVQVSQPIFSKSTDTLEAVSNFDPNGNILDEVYQSPEINQTFNQAQNVSVENYMQSVSQNQPNPSSNNVSNSSQVTSSTVVSDNDTQENKKQDKAEEKENLTPLQSLAKKLSAIKSQFIIEDDEVVNKADSESKSQEAKANDGDMSTSTFNPTSQVNIEPVQSINLDSMANSKDSPIANTLPADFSVTNSVNDSATNSQNNVALNSVTNLVTNSVTNSTYNAVSGTPNMVNDIHPTNMVEPPIEKIENNVSDNLKEIKENLEKRSERKEVELNGSMPDFLSASINNNTQTEAKEDNNNAVIKGIALENVVSDNNANIIADVTKANVAAEEEVIEEAIPLNEIPGISASDTWVSEPEKKPSLIEELAANPVTVIDQVNATNSVSPVSVSSNSVVDSSANSMSSIGKIKNKRYSYSIEQLLDIVIEKNGSDLHIQTGYPAMVRVDGSLLPVSKDLVTNENISELILPVMDEEKRDRFEVNREVDLAYAFGDRARFRVNAFHQKQSMAAAFRLIPSKIKSLEDLKLPPIYYELAKMHQGLVLVTGPTGHGKSTTLAAIIQEINKTRDARILTIEDPIEYIFPASRAMIAQREIQDDTHSWEIALKSALREDPDVILVGEMRDYETIASVITLAETGHLVFATLHTNSSAQTIDRIIDVFPENQQAQIRAQLSNVVEAVIAQRLIPLDKGGRKAASEIMLVNPAVRTLIREGKTHQLDNVIRTSADLGMISLESSLVKMVRDNEITMDKASRYALRPEEVIRLLKG